MGSFRSSTIEKMFAEFAIGTNRGCQFSPRPKAAGRFAAELVLCTVIGTRFHLR